uniref:DotA/TraY family protein n=2 Tax=Neptunomonas phycophila TaxID=1572645 RepID=UPI0035127249
RMRIHLKLFIFLLSISTIASGDGFSNISEQALDDSYAIQMYKAIFGGVAYYSVLDNPPDGTESALGAMALVFNLATFVVVSWLLFVLMMQKVIVSGNDGSLMSKRYNDTMAVTRGTISVCGLLPVVSGFCLAQVLVMFIAIQASFIADEVNKASAEYTFKNGSVSSFDPDYYKINNLVTQMADNAVCAVGINNYYAEHPDFASEYQVSFVSKPLKSPSSEVNGFRFAYANPKGESVCGEVSLSIGTNRVAIGAPVDGGEALTDPRGTEVFDQGLNAHETLLRDKLINAHAEAVKQTRQTLENAISLGMVRAGEDVDANAMATAIAKSKSFYRKTASAYMTSAQKDLDQLWDTEYNATVKSNSLALAAAQGWIYNGFTWIDKGKLESLMSRMSREIPTATQPDTDFMEGSFITASYSRSTNITKLIRKANTNESVNIDSESQLAQLQYDSLKENLLNSPNLEAWMASFVSDNVKTLFVDSQFNFRDFDPITNLQHLGYRMVNVGWVLFFVAQGLDVAVSAVDQAADQSWAVKIADLFSAGTIQFAAGTVIGLISKVGAGLVAISGFLIAVGSILAYWLPAMPFFMWTLAVMGNYLLVALAFLAAPLWIAAHVMPEGEGFSGDHARQGWMILLSILARPSIMVMAWHISFLLMRAMGQFTSLFLNYIPLANSEAMVGLWGAMMGIVVFLMIETVIAYRCISLIHEIPDQLPVFYGGQVTSGNEGQGDAKGQNIIAGWSGHTEKGIGGAMGGGGGGGGGQNTKGF